MEAVPRMPMIWLELKDAGEFPFSHAAKQYIQRSYGENPENYTEALKKLEHLRHNVVNVPRDFEGCNMLRKYFGQLHFLQSRVPMAKGQEAAVPVTWTDIFSGKQITHEDISYEQACVLYNLGALHSLLGAMDNRVSEEGMKTSCTHFQCSAGAFTYIRDHYNFNYSSDISHQALSINISLMLAQAQECLLEKTLLDNRKSVLIARICTQVCEYYKECVRVLENSEGTFGKKEWRKLIYMKISYFSAVTYVSTEHTKYTEYTAHALFKEGCTKTSFHTHSVQEALRFTMDVIGGKFNSARKDNDFIYHESVPDLEKLSAVKGASLVKPVPVSPTDLSVTGPDLFSKLVPMASHEASSLYSEEKAKMLREVMAKIDEKNQTLETFMDSLSCDSVDHLEMFSTVPPVLLEKCAALSVRSDAVKSLAQAMQALSGVYMDVGSSLEEARAALGEDEAGEKSLVEVVGQKGLPTRPPALQELQQELKKYETAHQEASHTNTELHRAMNEHIPNLRLLQGPLEELRNNLPQPQLSQEDTSSLQNMKRLQEKVGEMRKQRVSLEQQLRDLIQKDDITTVLVTTERYDIKDLFGKQLLKYDQLKGYIDQNLTAQDNILKALTEANVQYATVRRTITLTEEQYVCLYSVSNIETYRERNSEGEIIIIINIIIECFIQWIKSQILTGKEVGKGPPARPTAPKPVLGNKVSSSGSSGPSSLEAVGPSAMPFSCEDLPQELRCIPPEMNAPSRGAVPLTWPPGAAPMPQFNQAHFGYILPQHFQPGGTQGGAPVRPPNLQNAPQVPPQGYMPVPWQQTPGAPYTGPPRPNLPGQQVPMPVGQFPQQMPTVFPQTSSAQQIPPGTQYPVPQPRQSRTSQIPTNAIPAQHQPPSSPGQFQPMMPGQGQPQQGPAPVYWPSMPPQTQPQPGVPVQAQGPPLSGPPNQFLPGPPLQNQPQPQMGHVPPFFPPAQSQQIPGSFQRMPFSQNPQIPVAYHSSIPHQMPPGAVPPSNAQPGPPQTQQFMGQPPATTQFNPMFQPVRPPQPPSTQNFYPQNIPSSTGPVTQVLDNPNPPALADILTPSPTHHPIQIHSARCSNTPLNSATPHTIQRHTTLCSNTPPSDTPPNLMIRHSTTHHLATRHPT
uniref:Protein tyrosine phosphatase, non-receptor type 23, b n=1 Tax=Astyanax mexicanus TaxID=7994 RepID=W5LSE8_ASTMX